VGGVAGEGDVEAAGEVVPLETKAMLGRCRGRWWRRNTLGRMNWPPLFPAMARRPESLMSAVRVGWARCRCPAWDGEGGVGRARREVFVLEDLGDAVVKERGEVHGHPGNGGVRGRCQLVTAPVTDWLPPRSMVTGLVPGSRLVAGREISAESRRPARRDGFASRGRRRG